MCNKLLFYSLYYGIWMSNSRLGWFALFNNWCGYGFLVYGIYIIIVLQVRVRTYIRNIVTYLYRDSCFSKRKALIVFAKIVVEKLFYFKRMLT